MNINSIRGKKLELLAFLDFHQPYVLAIQETKIDSSIATSEIFPETCPYSVYRKDRRIYGGGVMLLARKDISHMLITELVNNLESLWVKVFANKTSHFVASWYRPPGSTSEEFHLFREQLDNIWTHHMGKKLPSIHVLGDFNFKDIDWPDRLSKSGSTLSVGGTNIDWRYEWSWLRTNGTLLHSRKEYIGLDSHHPTWSISRYPLPWQT